MECGGGDAARLWRDRVRVNVFAPLTPTLSRKGRGNSNGIHGNGALGGDSLRQVLMHSNRKEAAACYTGDAGRVRASTHPTRVTPVACVQARILHSRPRACKHAPYTAGV